MSKHKERKGHEECNAYVRLDWKLIDSAAFKTLSVAAVWVYIMLLRQFHSSKGGYDHLVLPFADVRWKMTFPAFKRALGELEVGGFIKLVHKGGLKGLLGHFGGPSIYSAGKDTKLSEKWRDRSSALFNDPAAGRMIRSQWYPKKLPSESQKNAAKAREARQRARMDGNGPAEVSSRRDTSVPTTPSIQETTRVENENTLDS